MRDITHVVETLGLQSKRIACCVSYDTPHSMSERERFFKACLPNFREYFTPFDYAMGGKTFRCVIEGWLTKVVDLEGKSRMEKEPYFLLLNEGEVYKKPLYKYTLDTVERKLDYKEFVLWIFSLTGREISEDSQINEIINQKLQK
jgi:hypothetical protein